MGMDMGTAMGMDMGTAMGMAAPERPRETPTGTASPTPTTRTE
ncbi:MAG: hypothetical protein QM778_35555 [Myxococcales bacterium]